MTELVINGTFDKVKDTLKKAVNDVDAQKTYESRVNSTFVEMRPIEKKIIVEVPNPYEPTGLKKVPVTIIYDKDSPSTSEGSALKIGGGVKMIQSDFKYIYDHYTEILRY